MAWLHATPRPPYGSLRAKTFEASAALSRFEQNQKAGVNPPMPHNPLPHIIERLTEIGLTGSNGMGATPLSWAEIAAWQANTSIRLTPWEARLIRALSTAYIAQMRPSEEETCPPPWRGEVTEAEKAAEVRLLDSILD